MPVVRDRWLVIVESLEVVLKASKASDRPTEAKTHPMKIFFHRYIRSIPRTSLHLYNVIDHDF